MSTISKRLDSLLRQKGYTKKFVAKKLQVSPDLVSKWCSKNPNTRRDPSTIHLVQLADLLNVSTDYLLGRTNEVQFKTEDEIINSLDIKSVNKLFRKHGVIINDENYSLEDLEAIIQTMKDFKKLSNTL